MNGAALLSQLDGDGVDQPTAYFSKKVLCKQNYSTGEKECLVIRLRVQTFRIYLLGRSFNIQTDDHSLEWLDQLEQDSSRLTQWNLSLQPFHNSFIDYPGMNNGNANTLSQDVIPDCQFDFRKGERFESLRLLCH